jgi:hypothetical protein
VNLLLKRLKPPVLSEQHLLAPLQLVFYRLGRRELFRLRRHRRRRTICPSGEPAYQQRDDDGSNRANQRAPLSDALLQHPLLPHARIADTTLTNDRTISHERS